MSLNPSTEQPAEAPVEGCGDVFATLITTQGRPVRLAHGISGELHIFIGDAKPHTLDPFQAQALALALGAQRK